MSKPRAPARERGGHHRVLGGGHARLVEEDLGALEAPGQRQAVDVVAQLDLGAELAEREHVGIDAPPADLVAAGAGEHRFTPARQEGRGEQKGPADARREGRVRRAAREPGGVDADRPLSDPGDLGPETPHRLQQGLDVADLREVVEDDRSRHEQ